jgi:hypothetical protein
MAAMSAVGDMDMVRCPGDGVDIGEPCADAASPSDRGRRLAMAWAVVWAPRARAAARACADSSIEPAW